MPGGSGNARATPYPHDSGAFPAVRRARVPSAPSTLPCRLGKTKGPANGPFVIACVTGRRHFFAGWTPGLSLKNCLLMSVNFFH
jgi:hypothetical protein